jgi:hypothetical protein
VITPSFCSSSACAIAFGLERLDDQVAQPGVVRDELFAQLLEAIAQPDVEAAAAPQRARGRAGGVADRLRPDLDQLVAVLALEGALARRVHGVELAAGEIDVEHRLIDGDRAEARRALKHVQRARQDRVAHVGMALGVDRIGAEHRHGRAAAAADLVGRGLGHRAVSPDRPS